MPDYSEYTDEELMATCAYKEARGELKFDGSACMAVMCVMKNRVGTPGFPLGLRLVILGPNQFSSMSRMDDPQYYSEPKKQSPLDPIYVQCLEDAHKLLIGEAIDITNGAHYYANLETMEPDGWFEREIVKKPEQHPFLGTIGRHHFYV